MKIQYASDLHLEFDINNRYIKKHPLPPVGDVLVLAGDILNFRSIHRHNDFFDYVSDNFESVYWVAGNHEYYHYDMYKKSGAIKEAIRSNVFFVNNVVEKIQDTYCLFTTLWSYINPVNHASIVHMINDFRVIDFDEDYYTPVEFNKQHLESLAFLKGFSKKEGEKSIVVSHHIPTLHNYPPEYLGDVLNEAFASSLDSYILGAKHDAWVYGHHHRNIPEFQVGSTRMLTNQLGYLERNEHYTFNPSKTFDI